MTRQHEIVTADIGGTHARFAIADMRNGLPVIGAAVKLRTADFTDLTGAWKAFAAAAGRPLPPAAGIALASPIGGEKLKLTNSKWVIRPASLPDELGVETLTLVNDFGAVAHAVAGLADNWFLPIGDPPGPLPDDGVTSIVGPGTGLGVAMLLRRAGEAQVIETEGGHMDFAPVDAIESHILDRLRVLHGRISVERIVSGPGLAVLHESLAALEGRPVRRMADAALWAAALGEGDPSARRALDRFCLSLGSVAGDLALAQGANAVVIAGGIGPRIAAYLPRSGFGARFAAKGRFQARMEAMPIRLLTYPQPGLFGAAMAFVREHGG